MERPAELVIAEARRHRALAALGGSPGVEHQEVAEALELAAMVLDMCISPDADFERMQRPYELRNLRIRSGLTQADVATRLGMTPQAVSNYERGINRVGLDIAIKLRHLYAAALVAESEEG